MDSGWKFRPLGEIYTEGPARVFATVVHEVSKVIISETVVWKFCDELKEKLYDIDWDECIFRYNPKEYAFGYTEEDLYDFNNTWIRMSYDKVSETIFSEFVTPHVKPKVKRVIIELWSNTCANIYAKIVEEICSITREPSALKSFCNKLYTELETNNSKSFFITANLGNIKISSIPEDIDDPIYDKENHYYHYFVDVYENANFVEIERIGE